jgi:hypothetical protein
MEDTIDSESGATTGGLKPFEKEGFDGKTISEKQFLTPRLNENGPLKDLHVNVIVKEHPIFGGKGIFATDFIHKGEIVWQDRTPIQEIKEYDIKDINTWADDKKEWFLSFAYQVGDTTFRGPENQIDTLDLYTNHSCDPSTWWVDESTMTARRDINVDDEITFDYSTSETIETAIHVCGCGAKDCRKIIGKDDYLRKEMQEKYAGHWMPYLQRRIDALEKESKFESK